MHDVYLILGSNLGDRIGNLQNATDHISRDAGKIVGTSAMYETEPWGFNHESYFINQVLRINTCLKPEDLLKEIVRIEKVCGRKIEKSKYAEGKMKNRKFEAREIDIDILFYNNTVYKSDKLIIPHPDIQERMFVLVPMTELQPDFVHPVLQKPVSYLKKICADRRRVKEYRD